jgi:microcystin-dependent protein
MKSLTDQFISDLYGSLLHVDADSLSSANVPDVYDGLGNKSALSVGLENQGAVITGSLSAGNIVFPQQPSLITLIDYIYPVGSCLLTLDSTNPSVRFVGTTWGRISEGKFLAGVGTGADKNLTNQILLAGDDSSIGEYTHRLTVTEMPSHTHKPKMRFMSGNDDNAASSGYMGTSPRALRDVNVYGDDLTPPTLEIDSVGGDQLHNNIPPYFGVYIWKRLT